MFKYIAFFFVLSNIQFANASCVNQPARHFALTGDEAEDKKTGLVWKRCAVGMSWGKLSKTCLGEPEAHNQETAKLAAAAAGPGWHVPTGDELQTLLVQTCEGQKIDISAFPATAASDQGEGANFWTSTEAMPDLFYYFDFTNGWADIHSAGYNLSVLLVKAGGSKKPASRRRE